MSSDTILVEADAAALARCTAEWFIGRLAQSTRPVLAVALAGGGTPLATYRLLAEPAQQKRIDWSRLHLFWGDERHVPHAHPESNFGAAWQAWLRHTPIAPANLHPMPVEASPVDAALAYEHELRGFHAQHRGDGTPLFDMVLLGLGSDGHTASLFPHDVAPQPDSAWVRAAHAPDGQPRLTLTPAALDDTHGQAFLVSGAAKRDIVKRVMRGDADLPASRLQPTGERFWLLDAEAGAGLSPKAPGGA